MSELQVEWKNVLKMQMTVNRECLYKRNEPCLLIESFFQLLKATERDKMRQAL